MKRRRRGRYRRLSADCSTSANGNGPLTAAADRRGYRLRAGRGRRRSWRQPLSARLSDVGLCPRRPFTRAAAGSRAV